MTDATNGAGDDTIVTVFDDPNNFNVKHQLQNKWTLWFTKPPSGKQDWNELLKEVITFDSVEQFWGVYVSRLALRASSDVHVLMSLVTEQYHSGLRARPEV